MFSFFLFQNQKCLNVNRTLKTLLLNLTPHFIWFADISVKKIRIGMTAARTEETCPTVAALFLIEDMALAEVLRKFIVCHTFIQ